MLLVIPLQAIAAPITQHQWIHQLGLCESGWSPNIKHLDSNDYYSYGVLQFQLGTWLAFGKQFGATKANIYDPALQEKVAVYLLDNGDSWRWKTCYNLTKKKLGAWPEA